MPTPHAHPARLRALAVAHGLASAGALVRFRYLELEPGDAASLRALAAAFPEAEFVGADDGATSDALTALAERCGLGNLRHVARDRLEGAFDFVVCHDRLARLEADERRAELATIARHLAPHAVALVSYPTLPGAAFEGLVRRTLGRALRDSAPVDERVWSVRARLSKIVRALPEDDSPSVSLLRQELAALGAEAQRAPATLLAPAPSPLHVADVVSDAARAGLGLVCDATPASIDGAVETTLVPQLVAEGLSRIEAEEVLDLVVNRRVRATLFCHAHEHPTLEPRWSALAEEGFFAAQLAWLAPEDAPPGPPNLEAGVPLSFETPTGVRIGSDEPLLKATLLALAESWPRGLGSHALASAATDRLALAELLPPEGVPSSELEAALASVLELVRRRQVELAPWTPSYDEALDYAPSLRLVSRVELTRAPTVLAARHQLASLDSFHHALALLLDGSRDLEACERALTDRLDAGALTIEGGLPADRTERARVLRLLILRALVALRNLGILNPVAPEPAAPSSLENHDHAP